MNPRRFMLEAMARSSLVRGSLVSVVGGHSVFKGERRPGGGHPAAIEIEIGIGIGIGIEIGTERTWDSISIPIPIPIPMPAPVPVPMPMPIPIPIPIPIPMKPLVSRGPRLASLGSYSGLGALGGRFA